MDGGDSGSAAGKGPLRREAGGRGLKDVGRGDGEPMRLTIFAERGRADGEWDSDTTGKVPIGTGC